MANSDLDRLERDIKDDVTRDIKSRLRRKLEAIVRTTNETPEIRFVDTAEGFGIEIDNCSEELNARLGQAIAEGGD